MNRIDNFEIIRPLRVADIGDLYLARDKSSGQTVELLILHPGPYTRLVDPYLREELRKLRGFSHPDVACVKETFEVDGKRIIISDHVEGETLHSYIHERNGLIIESRALPMIERLLDALSAIHAAGMLHLGLQPDEIIIDKEGNPHINRLGAHAAVALAKKESPSGASPSDSAIYMAPEASSDSPADTPTQSSDIYSLGMTAYEMLTGLKPRRTAGDDSLLPRIAERYAYTTAATQAFVDATTDPKTAARPAVCRDAYRILKGAGVASRSAADKKEKKTGGALVIGIIIGAILILGALGWLAYSRLNTEKTRKDYFTTIDVALDGTPHGVDDLYENQLSDLDEYYVITYVGDRIDRISHVGADVDAKAQPDSAFWAGNYAEAKFHYTSEGDPDYVELEDTDGETFYILDYEKIK